MRYRVGMALVRHRAQPSGARYDLRKKLEVNERWRDHLRMVTTKTGDILWVCPKHYKVYDPGLPTLPEQV